MPDSKPLRKRYKQLYLDAQDVLTITEERLVLVSDHLKTEQRERAALAIQVEQLVTEIQKLRRQKGVKLSTNDVKKLNTQLSSNYLQKIGVYQTALQSEADFWEETLGSDAPPSLARQARERRLGVMLKALSC